MRKALLNLLIFTGFWWVIIASPRKLLTAEEWELVNSQLPLRSTQNLEALVNARIHSNSANVDDDLKDWIVPDKKSVEDIRDDVRLRLLATHNRIVDSHQPYSGEIYRRVPMPMQYYLTLSFQYGKDINRENPLGSLLLPNKALPSPDSVAEFPHFRMLRLLKVPPEIGLQFTKEHQKWLIESFLTSLGPRPRELFTVVLHDPRVKMDESDKEWLLKLIIDRIRYEKTIGYRLLPVQYRDFAISEFLASVINDTRLRINRFDINRLSRESNDSCLRVLEKHPDFDREFVEAERKYQRLSNQLALKMRDVFRF